MFNAQQNVSSVIPAITSKMNSQVTFFMQISQKMIDATQQLATLNLQVAKTMLEEAATNTHQLLSVKNQGEAFSTASSQTQPAIEKVRAYQQHIQRIVSDTQADVAKSIEAYVPEATRTTQEVVQTLTKRAAEQTASIVQRQQDAVEQLTSVAKQNMNRAAEQTVNAVEQQKDVTEQLAAAAKQSAFRSADNSTKTIVAK